MLFYVQGRVFIEAGNLLLGDKLVSAIGEDLLIENYNVELIDELVPVYNFQVEDFHTYFVGDCAVWVHNSECGGSYGALKRDKNDKMYNPEEAHHMPAKDYYVKNKGGSLTIYSGPAVRMERGDHLKTASWGKSPKAKAYRDKQASLINAGKFREAVKMDIKDLRLKLGNKYDKGIGEMWKYINQLEKDGKI